MPPNRLTFGDSRPQFILGTDPAIRTPNALIVCGGECTSLSHWNGVGTPTLSTAQKRTGGGSIRINATGPANVFDYVFQPTNSAWIVTRFSIYFETLPTTDAQFWSARGSSPMFGYDVAAGKFAAWGVSEFAARAVGPAVTTGTWYTIDLSADISVTGPVIKWRVDGVDQPTFTGTTAAGTFSIGAYYGQQTGVGQLALTNYLAYYDDIVLSGTGGDYPIEPGFSSRAPEGWLLGTVPAVGNSLARSLADSLTAGDTVDRAGTFLRSTADAFGFSDAVDRVGTFVRTMTDALGFADSVSGIKLVVRSLVDSLASSDTVTRLFTGSRTATDSLTAGDTVARTGTFARTETDTLATSDSVTRTFTGSRTATDSLNLANVVARVGTFLRTATDAVTTSDAVVRVGTFLRTLSDSLGISEVVSGIKSSGLVTRTMSDALALADAVTRTFTGTRTLADSLSLGNTVSRVLTLPRTVADSLTTSDSVTRAGTFLRTAADSLTASDTVTRAGTFLRTATDSLATSSVVTGIGSILVTVGGFPPVARAASFVARSIASFPRPGGGASGPRPGGSASNPRPRR